MVSRTMKYHHRLISPFLNRNSHSHSLGFLRSKLVFFSTFSSSSSSTNLYQKPELGIPTNQSWSHTTFAQESTSSAVQEMKKPIPTQRVSAIVDEIAHFNLIETTQLMELLREKLGVTVDEMPILGVITPGMAFGGGKSSAKGGGGASVVEEKKEKTAFDLKLEGFEASAKIKIIKEVRTFTDLGLKEAKDLVEKAPTLLKKGVPKEEAQKIIDKMKEIGAKVVME